MKNDVFGLGNALMDIQTFVSDDEIKKLDIEKGIMHLIDEDKSRQILDVISSKDAKSLPGGSCANTVSGLSLLGGKAVYTGVVSNDKYGKLYEAKLKERGVTCHIRQESEGLTGTSIILTTEDAERTMATHLGVCRHYTKDDLDLDLLFSSKIFHCTGYQWDTPSQKDAVVTAMKKAKEAGVTISFDIADPFCIERNVDEFKEIIRDYVDILFGNKEEVKILTGKNDPVEAGYEIQKMGPKVSLVKVGKDGSYIFEKGKSEPVKVDVYTPDQVLDSTGCGDIYAAGFLYGYSKEYDLTKVTKIASYFAAQIISVPGVHFESLDFNKIKSFIDTI